MLEIDPKKRAKLDEILEEPWVQEKAVCQEIEPGKVLNADNHTHILEQGGAEKAQQFAS
jgi:hypothetical protein